MRKSGHCNRKTWLLLHVKFSQHNKMRLIQKRVLMFTVTVNLALWKLFIWTWMNGSRRLLLKEENQLISGTMLTRNNLSAALIKYLRCYRCAGVNMLYCSDGCQLKKWGKVKGLLCRRVKNTLEMLRISYFFAFLAVIFAHFPFFSFLLSVTFFPLPSFFPLFPLRSLILSFLSKHILYILQILPSISFTSFFSPSLFSVIFLPYILASSLINSALKALWSQLPVQVNHLHSLMSDSPLPKKYKIYKTSC